MATLKDSVVISITVLICTAVFVCVPQKADALTIVQTEDTAVSARVGTLPILNTGGGTYGNIQSGVRFSGLAYPYAVVTIMKNLVEVTRVTADAKGVFSITIPEDKWSIFTLSATDTMGRKSTLLNFPLAFYSGLLTDINGIRFAPTITSDKIAVKQFDYLTVEGSALEYAPVELLFEGLDAKTYTPVVGPGGIYTITVPVQFAQGEYLLRAKYVDDSRTSRVLRLVVGTANMFRTEATNNRPGDCNFDQNVNLVDFSVLAYWYGKSNPPVCVDTNHDKKIDLVDFSILAFYWNG